MRCGGEACRQQTRGLRFLRSREIVGKDGFISDYLRRWITQELRRGPLAYADQRFRSHRKNRLARVSPVVTWEEAEHPVPEIYYAYPFVFSVRSTRCSFTPYRGVGSIIAARGRRAFRFGSMRSTATLATTICGKQKDIGSCSHHVRLDCDNFRNRQAVKVFLYNAHYDSYSDSNSITCAAALVVLFLSAIHSLCAPGLRDRQTPLSFARMGRSEPAWS